MGSASSGNRKVFLHDAVEIRERCAAGESYAEVGHDYGVTGKTVLRTCERLDLGTYMTGVGRDEALLLCAFRQMGPEQRRGMVRRLRAQHAAGTF